MSQTPDLTPATAHVAALVHRVRDDDLVRPTPCDYDVATLLDHLSGLALAFTLAARKSDDPLLGAAPAPSGAALDPSWRDLLPRRLSDLAQAWRDPSAWSGFTRAGGVDLPGEVAGVVALNEVVIHGWDLAVATGQSYEVDDATLAVVERFAEESARPEGADMRDGVFGPVRDVPADATRFERVLALDGRSPSWPR